MSSRGASVQPTYARFEDEALLGGAAAARVGAEQQEKMIEIWLGTPFEGGRHERRLQKITALEAAACDG